MSIVKLLDILRDLGRKPSTKEVAEVLWWMLRTEPAGALPVKQPWDSVGAIDSKDEPKTLEPPGDGDRQKPEHSPQPPNPVEVAGRKDPDRLSPDRGLPLVVRDPKPYPVKAPPRGLPLPTPAGTPLPDALNIARALRPLRRSVPLSNIFTLDEQATAHRSAEEHMLVPILRRLDTRWLTVDVVVDESDSMLIWRSTVLEFVRLLARQGAFRDVRVWGLDPSSADPKQPPRLHAELRRSGQAGNVHSPSELVDVGGRRLVLIVSDCIAPGWHSGAVAQLIRLWTQTNPVAIIQMLPRWLWERTSLGREIGIELRSPYPGAPNTQAIVRPCDERLDDDDEVPFGVSTPVLSLDPDEVTAWAHYIVSAPHAWTRGVQLSTVLRTPQTREHQDADLLLSRFYANASPAAQALAERLAAAPLTLPVINLVQQAICNDPDQNDTFKHPSQIYTAEVLLGGLAHRETSLDQYVSPDEILYEFLPGVREQLLARLEHEPLKSTIDVVSNYIEHASQVRQMRSGVIGVPSAGQIAVVEALPFARIQALLLRNMGYTALAEWLEREAMAQAAVASLIHRDPDIVAQERFVKACQLAREYCSAVQNQLEEERSQQEHRYKIIENERRRQLDRGVSPYDKAVRDLDQQLNSLAEQIGTLLQALETLGKIQGFIENDERYDEIEHRCNDLGAVLQLSSNESIKQISSVLLQALDATIADAATLVDTNWIESDNIITKHVFNRYPAYKPADVQRREWAVKAFKKALVQDDRYEDLAREIAQIQQAYWANQDVSVHTNALSIAAVRDSSWILQAKYILERLDGLQDLPEIQAQLPFDAPVRLQRRDVLALRLFVYQLNYQGFRELLAELTLPSTLIEELMLEQQAVETVEQAAGYYRNQEWEAAVSALQAVSEPYVGKERTTALQKQLESGQQSERQIKHRLEKIERQLHSEDIVSDSSISFAELASNLADIQFPPDWQGSGIISYHTQFADLKQLFVQRWQERAEYLLAAWGGLKSPVVRPWLVDMLQTHAKALPTPASESHKRSATMLRGWAQVAEALLIIDEDGRIDRADELLQSGVALLQQVAPESEQMSEHPILAAVFARIAKQPDYISDLKQEASKARSEKRLDEARKLWDQVIRLDPDDKEVRNERVALSAEINRRLQEAQTAYELEDRALREAIRLWREVEATYIDGQYPPGAMRRMSLKRWLRQAEEVMRDSEQHIARLCPEAQQLCSLIMQVKGSQSEQFAGWNHVTVQVQAIERSIAAVHSGMQSEIPAIYRELLIVIKEYISAHRDLLQYLSGTSKHKNAYTLIADLQEQRAKIQSFDQNYQNNAHFCDLQPIDEVIAPSWKQVEDIARLLGIKA